MPRRDSEVGCIIPDPGHWPVDPQEDAATLDDDSLWIDGCFDFFHHGHAGVMLNARKLVGATPSTGALSVGIHSDAEILKNKGPTVMNLEERVAAVDACRWSTKSVPDAPYVTSLAWIGHYGCRYVVHGDDITSDANGNDCYRFVKRAGRMKIVPRTPGISTTDLVGRMLLCTKEHFIKSLEEVLEGKEGMGEEEERKARGNAMLKRFREYASAPNTIDPYVSVEHNPGRGDFNPIVPGHRPRPGQRVVYVDGGFDLFSSGHIAFLQRVAELETEHGRQSDWFTDSARETRIRDHGEDYGPAYVIAGVHDDDVINFYKGINYPIMNIFERGLCVVQCTYIHAVVFGAPFVPSTLFLRSLPGVNEPTAALVPRAPDAVYHGPTSFMSTPVDPYADAKALGIFTDVGEHRFQDVNSAQIVQRILDNRVQYEERQRKKGVKSVGEEATRRREEMQVEAEEELQRRRREVERLYGA
ncbi:hypothetical protein K431DRAFT_266401 [Polychaeton citri CBS 116435]|uniref:ethanolamine-phosphate cytidylyltransferase n=1 Tax=Polychaeton citri CBS 116435 TaxID=1314669 RepID=A0A9P4Q9U3_9PEZI|nr:hypothetical protein K431DRAFT_266401 [Polychaeton citri CBS 116435]